jgi:hypothetical protein
MTEVGTPGTVGKVTEFDEALAALIPTAFVAVTVKVKVPPAVSAVTVHVSAPEVEHESPWPSLTW